MTTEPDPPAVPGLEPADGRRRPLDRSQDPDRYDPDRDDPNPDDPNRDDGPVFDPEEHPRVVEPAAQAPGRLDPAQDPDRFLPPGQGQSLTDLLGKAGTHEGDRDGYQWIAGLLAVIAFLALVTFLFSTVLTP
jgi:hypothetical protein